MCGQLLDPETRGTLAAIAIDDEEPPPKEHSGLLEDVSTVLLRYGKAGVQSGPPNYR